MNVKFSHSQIIETVILLFLVGCNTSESDLENYSMEADVENSSEISSYKTIELSQKTDKNTEVEFKIIRTANTRYKVDNVSKSGLVIQKIAHLHNGYISDSKYENNKFEIKNFISVKIPSEYFSVVLDSIRKTVEFVDYENITSNDVTEEYTDLNTRLKTKIEVKQRYEEVLKRNATTVEDILATEDKLRIIQEEIESAQGRIRYLSDKVAYSTININLYQSVKFKEEPIVYTKSFWVKIKNGVQFGWSIIENTVIAMIYIWPIVILILAGYIIYRTKFISKK